MHNMYLGVENVSFRYEYNVVLSFVHRLSYRSALPLYGLCSHAASYPGLASLLGKRVAAGEDKPSMCI